MDNWGWMIGTGIYLDDVDAALAKIDAQQSRNIEGTMLWIAGAGDRQRAGGGRAAAWR